MRDPLGEIYLGGESDSSASMHETVKVRHANEGEARSIVAGIAPCPRVRYPVLRGCEWKEFDPERSVLNPGHLRTAEGRIELQRYAMKVSELSEGNLDQAESALEHQLQRWSKDNRLNIWVLCQLSLIDVERTRRQKTRASATAALASASMRQIPTERQARASHQPAQMACCEELPR